MKSRSEFRPRRGWIYMADLNPGHGTEPGKVRPVLALQTDLLNSAHASTVVLPLTTKVYTESRFLRIHMKKGEAGLSADSDVMIDQLRSIDNGRFRRILGQAPTDRLAEVESAVTVLLDLALAGPAR